MTTQTLGQLTGVSVGPGDPELITLKGLRALERAAVVAFPAGIQGRSGVAQGIIASYLQSHQILLPLDFPYVRERKTLTTAWRSAAAAVWSYLEQGMDVAFACEGDISFYSTFTYLAQTLQDVHPDLMIHRIAGVCSPLAAASALGIPLTCQEQKLAILPALYDPSALVTALDWAEVVVLMKVRLVYETVWQILADRQLLDRAWVMEQATTQKEQVYHPLRAYPQLELSYFSVLLIQNDNLPPPKP